jgi:phage-related baseplate assembly protein
MNGGLTSLPLPRFLNDPDGTDPNLILADMVAAFESAAGRKLQPAQVERLLINLYAYRESLMRNAIQYAAQQNLLAFASFPMIDYLGELLGVTRLDAQPAGVVLQFTLLNPLTFAYTVAAGTQVATGDGQQIFVTDSDLTIAPGAASGTVDATAVAPGAGGNGYLPGQINVPLNPSALISGVSNINASTGGSAPESDDHLRTRIQAAPNQFSAAGPTGAYRFFALGTDPAIADVQVVSPAPGQVDVYVLTGPITAQPAPGPNSVGLAGPALLAAVEAALNADTIRPITDTVAALAVSEIDYQIDAAITLYSDADPSLTMAAVETAAQQVAIQWASQIQRDIVPSQIIAALSVPGVYEVVLNTPVYTQLSAGQWANCTSIVLEQSVSNERR